MIGTWSRDEAERGGAKGTRRRGSPDDEPGLDRWSIGVLRGYCGPLHLTVGELDMSGRPAVGVQISVQFSPFPPTVDPPPPLLCR